MHRYKRQFRGWMVRFAAFAAISCSVLAGGLAFSSSALASSAPSEVQTEPAEVIPGGAKLKGKVNPGGLPTTYYFEYARDTCDEGCTPSKTTTSGPLTGDTQQEVPAIEVTGLTDPGGTERYWYQLVASNADGTVYGGLVNFTPGVPLPSISSESASHVTSTDATLGAEINLHEVGAGAYYQFQLVTDPSEFASEILCPAKLPPATDGCIGIHSASALPIGFIPGNTMQPGVDLPAILDLAGAGVTLEPGTTYHYRVLVARRVQTEDTIQWEDPIVYGSDQTFTTPSAGTAPVIDSVSVSHLTPTDATLEGQINTEGLSTMYEFRLTYTRCRECMSPTYNIPLPSGLLLGSFQDQGVSVDLNSVGVTLKPGFYEYSLSATSTGGSTEAHGGSFEPPLGVLDPPSPGASPLPGAAQPAGSTTNSNGQPAGSGSSSSSSTSGVQPPDLQVPKTKLEPLTSSQKLAKALKLCDKKPKKQRPSCKRQAEKNYAAKSKHRL
jgi:hypothetical protein